ncbi:hypothetical protein [Pseudomonas sp. PSE14]|uniref:hypothetical protein n=1 Tax=Pseudomonas sp. PSE14 TaxID=3016341 RepID=UPI0023D7C295|nr:hypothetical protein [Pseudomonas sp. PSE14]WEJ70451.1 hypothetical protein O6P39_17440 [Pseudomonas sp. PSE14]
MTLTAKPFQYNKDEYDFRCEVAKEEYENSIAALSLNGGALVRVSVENDAIANLLSELQAWTEAGYTFVDGSGVFIAGNILAGIWPEFNCTFRKPLKTQERELKKIYAKVLDEYTKELAEAEQANYQRLREEALMQYRAEKLAAELAAEEAYLAAFDDKYKAERSE